MTLWKVSDLAGCEVYDAAGNRLGVLIDVLPTGGNDVWVVKSPPPENKETLVPALVNVVREVNIQEKRITVDLPPGLQEIYEEAFRSSKEQKLKNKGPKE